MIKENSHEQIYTFDGTVCVFISSQFKSTRADSSIDYVKRNNKAILNVEVIRKNMDEPREFWTYDCRKVK